MEINNLYVSKLQSKSGIEIPALLSGRTIESKYNPQREAENLINSIEKAYNFFVVFGVGSGLFISELSKKYNDAIILCIENTQKDIDFLRQFSNIQNLSKNENIKFSTLENFQKDLIQYYIPTIYGDLKIIEILPWMNENHDYLEYIKQELNKAIQSISADYSVQSHFGKLWQKNIINNLKFCNKFDKEIKIETSKKTAVIIAAGPTLDSKISYLKENLEKFFIISTDTAYQTLVKENIFPQMVVSIDGQFISHEHFINSNNTGSTIFAFDLCSNNSTLRHFENKNIFFFNSGHPLSAFAATYSDNVFPTLFSGAGTVTITAFDLAVYLGFEDIQVIAADFSYHHGKAYSKGTYLDSIYGKNSNKLVTFETLFSKLMFRTELLSLEENIKTTQVLESYKSSFEKYLEGKKFIFEKKDDIYFTSKKSFQNNCCNQIIKKINNHFDFDDFMNKLKYEYKKGNFVFLLPFISYLRKNQNSFESNSFDSLVKLAYSELVSYNNFI